LVVPAPNEFAHARYDFCSEVYFVGKLFEKIIQDHDIATFQYIGLLGRMCQMDPQMRIQSFTDVEKEVDSNQFFEIDFTDQERESYQEFADAICRHVTKLESGAQYSNDPEVVQKKLEEAYRGFMLEATVPDAAIVLRPLINGVYYYRKAGLPVGPIKGLLRLLKVSNEEKRRIIFANLHKRFDALPRFTKTTRDDDVPF
jgi:hypothetical protein